MQTARPFSPFSISLAVIALSATTAFAPSLQAQTSSFHKAPATTEQDKNPYSGQAAAATAGRAVYEQKCLACHGPNALGAGNIPNLREGPTQTAAEGSIFWYITKGDLGNGMPPANVSEEKRWQVVTYLKTLPNAAMLSAAAATSPAPASASASTAPPPPAPFTDYRYQKPGLSRWIKASDLPEPAPATSSSNGPKVVPRPANAWPIAPAGFKVELYAEGLHNPRLIRTAPNGDMFLAETRAGDIKVFRGITPDGKPGKVDTFATGLKGPFGIAFYPLGPNPQWVYIGNLTTVVRFPYHNGDMTASGPSEHIADIPGGGGHTTRDVQFSLDGKTMFVSVGSGSNVDDPDTTPEEHNRADILAFTPDGSGMHIYAAGIRNPVGIAVNPITGELWCSVNERDGLGNNLVPDYITHVQAGGFYGWPWWYTGSHQDPRHMGKHPELKGKVIVPDVLLQPHNASLEMTFYSGNKFPAEYKGDIFAAEHGSWNRNPRAGYEVIRVPLHQTGHAKGDYQDFLTGFVVDDSSVWGRPVGVTTAPDGSLLVTDDGSESIWRVSYTGK
jgi:glucose/arabinose dehydrogenase/cytochrome c5